MRMNAENKVTENAGLEFDDECEFIMVGPSGVTQPNYYCANPSSLQTEQSFTRTQHVIPGVAENQNLSSGKSHNLNRERGTGKSFTQKVSNPEIIRTNQYVGLSIYQRSLQNQHANPNTTGCCTRILGTKLGFLQKSEKRKQYVIIFIVAIFWCIAGVLGGISALIYVLIN